MATNLEETMIESPFSLEWTISEESLIALKDSLQYCPLKTQNFNVFKSNPFYYNIQIYHDKSNDDENGSVLILLNTKMENQKADVHSDYAFSVMSVNWKFSNDTIFDGFIDGYAADLCKSEDFFNPEKKYIVDGKFIVKIEGIFKTEKSSYFWNPSTDLYQIWNQGFEDFTIIVDKKEIQVHKCVMAACSPVFSAMFRIPMKESAENKVEIPDFSFEIVEKSVKLCYHQILVSDLSDEDIKEILRFADKYNIAKITDNLGFYLSDKLSTLNIEEYIKIAIENNVEKLRNKCIEFVVDCFSKKEIIPNLDQFDESFMADVQGEIICHKSTTT